MERTRGWVVGRVAGAPVVLTPSSAVVALVLALLFAPTVRARAPQLGPGSVYLVAASLALALLLSVLVHEVAHALVARARGLRVRELALTLVGGHTAFDGGPVTPATTALVAVVGPTANLVLAAVLGTGAALAPRGGLADLVLYSAAYANAFVGVFNLVPGLPLDGGAVLEALVWRITGDRRRGSVVAGWAGRVVAVVFVAWVVLPSLLRGARPDLAAVAWAVVVGAFLWSGAGAVIASARRGRVVDALDVRSVGVPAVGVAATATLAEADAARGIARADAVVLLSPDGRPAAYVDPAAAASVPAVDRVRVPVTAVAVALPAGAVVDARLRGPQLLHQVGTVARFAPVMVAVQDGVVAALVRSADVAERLRG